MLRLLASGDDGSQVGGEEHSETGEKWGRNEDYPIGDEIRSILEVSSEQLRKFYIIIMKKSACFALFFMVNWITVICYILIPCSPQWEGREVQKEVH